MQTASTGLEALKRLIKTNHKEKASYFYTWSKHSQLCGVSRGVKGNPERLVNETELVSCKVRAGQGKGEKTKNINLRRVNQALKKKNQHSNKQAGRNSLGSRRHLSLWGDSKKQASDAWVVQSLLLESRQLK